MRFAEESLHQVCEIEVAMHVGQGLQTRKQKKVSSHSRGELMLNSCSKVDELEEQVNRLQAALQNGSSTVPQVSSAFTPANSSDSYSPSALQTPYTQANTEYTNNGTTSKVHVHDASQYTAATQMLSLGLEHPSLANMRSISFDVTDSRPPATKAQAIDSVAFTPTQIDDLFDMYVLSSSSASH
jgi:hypothetical protein